jgi:hypothetical protein
MPTSARALDQWSDRHLGTSHLRLPIGDVHRLFAVGAMIECRAAESDPWCRKCGSEDVVRDAVTRRLTERRWDTAHPTGSIRDSA